MKIILAKKVKLAILLFILILSVCSIWAINIPGGSEAPDESQHIDIVYFLKAHHRIPIFDKENDIVNHIYSRTSFGFVYYSMAYNSPIGYLPYLFTTKNNLSSQINQVLASRFISSLELALFSVFLFLTLIEIDKKRLLPAFATSIIISLIPQLTFSGSYVNLEPFSLLISAISLFLFIKLRNKPEKKFWDFIIFGFFLGILGLCKANYYILIFYFGLLILYDFVKTKGIVPPCHCEEERRGNLFNRDCRASHFVRWLAMTSEQLQGIKKKIFIQNYLIAIATFAIVNLWWWIRNFRLFRDPLILTYIRREIIDKAPDWVSSPHRLGYNFFSIFRIPTFVETTFKGFYAYLGGLSVLLPSYIYIIALVLLIIISILSLINTELTQNNTVRASARTNFSLHSKNKCVSSVNKFYRQYFYFFIITSIVALAYYINKNLYDYSPQGRHLFPLIIPLAIVIFIGISNLKLLFQKIFCSFLIIYSAIISFYSLLSLINQYYVIGTAYRVGAIRTIDNFSWHHLTLGEFRRLLDFIFINNPAFFSTAFFFVLIAVIGILVPISVIIIFCWKDENSDFAKIDIVRT